MNTNDVKALVHWYVTTRCNSRCKTCSIWCDDRYKSEESSLESRLGLLEQLKAMRFLSIDFTGGEPLLYPGLPKLIQAAKKMGFMTWLTTNSLLYPKYAEALRGAVTQLSFSLDSPFPERNDEIRGIPHFKKAIKAIKLAMSLGEIPMIKATISKENVDDLQAFANLARKLGVLIEFNAEFAYFGNPALDRPGIGKIQAMKGHPNVIISKPHLQFMLDGGNNPRRPECHIGQNMIVIAPDNSLYYPCMHLVQEHIPLKNGSIRETMAQMRQDGHVEKVGRLPFCRRCTIPCYMEPAYTTNIDKYFVQWFAGRLDYVRKRLALQVANRFGAPREKGTRGYR
nr:radical SAM protein [Candidatus Sigynarchaeum springense]